MKTLKWIVAAMLLAVAGIGSAWADHRSNVHFGVMIGPSWGPWYGPPAYYYPPYYPPVVIERQAPPVYIQQVAPAPMETAPAQSNYWYYCAAGKGYYPYVKECPGGWQRVSPQPPGQP